MDEKETSLTSDAEQTPTESTPDKDRRGRWRAHHTVAAAIITVCALVFTYAGATAASTIERAPEDSPIPAQILTVADVSYLVTDEGQLYSQGLNNTGQLGIGSISNSPNWTLVKFPVEGDQPKITKVSSYGEHAIALDEAGKLWIWGDAQNAALGSRITNVQVTPMLLNVSYSLNQLAAGDSFAVALDSRGKLQTWGQNDAGQLGTGDTDSREGPTLIAQDQTFKYVAAGSDFAFAIDNGGALWAWGSNDSGQFGNGTKDSSNVPVQVSGGPWQAVFPSRFSDVVLAINSEGVLHSWGPGANALIGNGRDWRGEQAAENKRVEDEKARIKAEDDARRAAIVAELQAVELAKLVSAWTEVNETWTKARDAWLAANPEPKLQDFPNTTPPTPTPTPTPGVTPTPTPPASPYDLAAYEKALGAWNDARTAWLTANPEVPKPTDIPAEAKAAIEEKVTAEFEFTDTSDLVPAVIKEPEIGGESLTPVAIATGSRFTKATVGSENAFAIDSEGHLWAWGSDLDGQTGLGLDEKTHTHTPVKMSDAVYNDVFAGPRWAAAVAANGLFTWGVNDSSNRLLSAEKKLLSPTSASNENLVRIAGTTSSAVASRNDGGSFSWGENLSGLAGQNSEENTVAFASIEGNFQKVAFGSSGVLALGQGNGYIYFWGDDRDKISSGDSSTAAVLTPTRQVISKFADIAAGRLSTNAVDANGFVWTWGLSWMGNLAAPAKVIESPTKVPLDARITHIAAAQTDVALVSDENRIYWWGAWAPNFSLTEIPAPEGESFGTLTQVVAGIHHFLFRNEEGKVWHFSSRYNEAQPLGAIPLEIKALELPGPASFVSAGGDSSAAVIDGIAYGWGNNSNGQLVPGGDPIYFEPTELPPPLSGQWASLAVSKTHTLAATEKGVLYGWGLSEYIGGFGIPVEAPVHIKIPREG